MKDYQQLIDECNYHYPGAKRYITDVVTLGDSVVVCKALGEVCNYLKELEEGGGYEFLEGVTNPDWWLVSETERQEITNKIRVEKGLEPTG